MNSKDDHNILAQLLTRKTLDVKLSLTMICALLIATSANADRDRYFFRLNGGLLAFPTEAHQEMKLSISSLSATEFYSDDNLDVSLAASGGVPPYRWKVRDGILPPGVNLSGGGQLYGRPTEPGDYHFTLEVSDTKGSSSTNDAAITVYDEPSILRDEINPSNFVRNAQWQRSYSFKGAKVESASVSVSGLPTGLSYTVDNADHSVKIAGTPTVEGVFPIEISLTDGSARQTRFPDEIVVASPITANGAPGFFYRNEPLDYTLVASGGNGGPYTFKAGPYPDYGVNTTITPGGRVTGSFSNMYFEEFLVTDVAGVTARLLIKDYNPISPLDITTYAISGGPQGYRMTTYPIENTQFTLSGGKAPYSWSTNTADLPPGTSFSTQGVFSGTPTDVGTYDFLVEVTDANGRKTNRSIQLTISPCGHSCLN
jgi:hypothetical protein